jgi:two-component system response regulator YesN
MIKFLIVDDEEIIRRGIRAKINKLIEKAQIVGEAADGEEALLMVEKLQPDVIITDIKMPKLDGLLFIENALSVRPEAQFIIISGHQDFSYAKKALRLGVCDYLLKPVDNDELKSVVQRLIETIENRKHHQQYINGLKERVKDNEIQRKNQILTGMITGADTTPEDLVNYQIKQDEKAAVCVVQISDFGDMFSTANQQLAAFAASNVFEETLKQEIGCQTFQTDQTALSFTGILYGDLSSHAMQKQLRSAIKSVKEWLNISIYVGLGGIHQGIGDISESLTEAQTAIEQRIVFEQQEIITFDEYLAIQDNDYILSENKKRMLESLLKAGDNASAIETVGSIFKELKEKKIIKSKVEGISIEVLLLLINVLKVFKQYDYTDLTNKSIDRFFTGCGDYNEYLKLLSVRITQVCEAVTRGDVYSGRTIIKKIVTLIEDEYYRDIKLNDIADEYYINTSYLSQLFLQEMKKNFKQYLSEVRISNAKNLLENTSFSVSRIAELIGYNDRAYFSKAFLKLVGTTPAQYRAENGSER